MSLVDLFRDNAADCAFLTERSEEEETKLIFKRMEMAWRTLANQQELLDSKGRTKKAAPSEAAVSVRMRF
jgi:hypothetical protein